MFVFGVGNMHAILPRFFCVLLVNIFVGTISPRVGSSMLVIP